MTALNGQPPGSTVLAPHHGAVDALAAAVFDQAPIPACLADADGQCLAVNQALCRLLDRSAAELVGLSCLSWMHPADLAQERDRLEAVFARRVLAYEAVVRLTRAGGGTIWVREHVSVVSGNSGAAGDDGGWRPDYVVRQVVDATHERAAARTLERAAVNDARTSIDFLSQLSHELRTPLSSVVGFAELLAESLSDPTQCEAARHISVAGQHLTELVDHLVDFSRADSDRLDLRIAAVDVWRILYEVAAMAQPAAQAAGVRVRVVPPAIGGCAVVADHRCLIEILLNLISNAIKFSPPGSVVRCTALAGGGRVEIAVADDGPGLTASEQLRLFMPFERLGARQRGIPGTGLGLALSRRLAEAMAGTVSVNSAPGRGSTFSVSLPLAEPLAMGAPPAAFAWSAKRHGVLRRRRWSVLYVEEDRASVRLVDAVLSRYTDIVLSVAGTGSEALTRMASDPPDVVLLDMTLPDVSVAEVMAKMQAAPDTANVPVVVISGHSADMTAMAVREAGVQWFVPKPIRVGALLDALAAALEAEPAT